MKLLFSPISLVFFCACASVPRMESRPSVEEYMLDFDAQVMRGSEEKDDLPLSYCKDHACYVLKDEDLVKIKLYIVELEDEKKACLP